MIEVRKGQAIKGRWGQWYRIDTVTRDGIEVGRVQVRRRYYGKRIGHRVESITLNMTGACVLGTQLDWLS